jgi:hypothetical protein
MRPGSTESSRSVPDHGGKIYEPRRVSNLSSDCHVELDLTGLQESFALFSSHPRPLAIPFTTRTRTPLAYDAMPPYAPMNTPDCDEFDEPGDGIDWAQIPDELWSNSQPTDFPLAAASTEPEVPSCKYFLCVLAIVTSFNPRHQHTLILRRPIPSLRLLEHAQIHRQAPVRGQKASSPIPTP